MPLCTHEHANTATSWPSTTLSREARRSLRSGAHLAKAGIASSTLGRNSAQELRYENEGTKLISMSTILANAEAIATLALTLPSWIAANIEAKGATA